MTARHSTYRLHEAMPQTANGLGGFLHHVRGHDLLIIEEAGTAVVAALDQVQWDTGKNNASSTGHGVGRMRIASVGAKQKTVVCPLLFVERQLKKIDRFLRLSMTYDRGSEMAEHPLMSKHLKMAIYFADPHAPWQQRKHQWPAAAILPEGHRPVRCEPGPPERRRVAAEHPAKKTF